MPLHACVETATGGNVSAYAGPEFFQFGGLIAVLITPIQLNFDCLELILRRHRLPVIDIGRDPLAGLGQRGHPVELETAFLQLSRGPISVSRASVTPHFRRR